MTTREKIHEALQMINSHDWYWMMVDFGYEKHYNIAKAGMREFVRFVNTIDNTTVREALRRLWVIRHDEARNAINGKESSTEEEKSSIMNTLALAA